MSETHLTVSKEFARAFAGSVTNFISRSLILPELWSFEVSADDLDLKTCC